MLDNNNEDETWNLLEIRVRKMISNILSDVAAALINHNDENDRQTESPCTVSAQVKTNTTKMDKEYEQFEHLWKKYKEASKRFKGMKDLIKVDSLFSFVVTASQYENILALYRTVSAELLKDSSYETSSEYSDMLDVLKKLFDKICEAKKDFVYVPYSCDLQKKYDLDNAIKMPNDPEAGKVVKVVLWGIRNKITKKIEHKCIVRVG